MYTQAYSPAAICRPSRASILTGRTPADLKFTNDSADLFNAAWETIPEALKAIGPYTAAHIGKWHLSDTPGDHGFDHWDLNESQNNWPAGDPKWMASITQAALDFMATATPPFYLQISHFAVHAQLTPTWAALKASRLRP